MSMHPLLEPGERNRLVMADFNAMVASKEVVALDVVAEIRAKLDEALRTEQPWEDIFRSFAQETVPARVQIAQDAAVALYRHDGVVWSRRMQGLGTPTDFRRFFNIMGVSEGVWRKVTAMMNPEGPVQTASLAAAIKKRFGSYGRFVAWMDEREFEEPLTDRIEKCNAKEEYLALFASLGVPGDMWKSPIWMESTSNQPPPDGIRKSLAQVVNLIRKKEEFDGSYKSFVAWMTGTPLKKSIKARLKECRSPADAKALIESMNIPGDKWKSPSWMREGSKASAKEGGIGKCMSAIVTAAETDPRFRSYAAFIAWIEGTEYEKKNPSEASERLASCSTPAAVFAWFAELGIPNDAWKKTDWMQKTSKLPPPMGIGSSKKDILNAVTGDARFGGSYPRFVAWMENIPADDGAIKAAFAACATPADVERLFESHGLSGRWHSSHWLRSLRRTKVADEERRTGLSLFDAIMARFGRYETFTEWMTTGREERQETFVDAVAACTTREEFLVYFASLGTPKGKWKSSRWFSMYAHKPVAEGGAGRSLSGVVGAIGKDPRFKSYKNFLVWMNNGDKSILPFTDRVRACTQPADFLELFASLGIPGNKWRSSKWLVEISKLPQDQGGIGENMCAIQAAVRNDERFGGFTKFKAWMDGKKEAPPSYNERIQRCATRDDFRAMFRELGIPEETWRSTGKMDGRNRTGSVTLNVAQRIREDKRFRSYPRFLAWMDGYEHVDATVKARIAACAAPEDFNAWYDELGVPVRQRRNFLWFTSLSSLPPSEGGIGRSLQDVAFGIIEDERFGSYRTFLSWMEGDMGDVSKKVSACTTQDDFLALLRSYGIEDERWKDHDWMNRDAILPPSHGGVGRGMRKFLRAVQRDPRFDSYGAFVEWMESGLPPISSDEEALRALRGEAARLGVSVDELLQPDGIVVHGRRSRVLEGVFAYMAAKRSSSST